MSFTILDHPPLSLLKIPNDVLAKLFTEQKLADASFWHTPCFVTSKGALVGNTGTLCFLADTADYAHGRRLVNTHSHKVLSDGGIHAAKKHQKGHRPPAQGTIQPWRVLVSTIGTVRNDVTEGRLPVIVQVSFRLVKVKDYIMQCPVRKASNGQILITPLILNDEKLEETPYRVTVSLNNA